MPSFGFGLFIFASEKRIEFDFQSHYYLLTSLPTIFLTMGATILTIGKATIKPKPQAFSQIIKKFETKPTLKRVITRDMIHDINNAMKKANKTF